MDKDTWSPIAFSAALDFAKETIKGCLLINGGAAAGIVTFLPSAKVAGFQLQTMACAAMSFGVGAFLGVFAFGLSYVAQIIHAEDPRSKTRERIFDIMRYLAVAAVLFSGGAFLWGLSLAVDSLPLN